MTIEKLIKHFVNIKTKQNYCTLNNPKNKKYRYKK